MSTLRRLLLVGILALSAGLNLYRLDAVGRNGIGNYYYAAAVKSMLISPWHCFYLAFDPAGFVSVDKAPLALWIQTAAAGVFGFNGLSLMLPQVLAGLLAVLVLYDLVRRAYGPWPALLATLALAVMPVSVVIQRSNSPDALLVLVLLLAAWAVARSVERGSLGALLAGAVLVGVAFNVKMLQILLVVPALAALYLGTAPVPWRRRLGRAALAVLVALAVCAPWVLAVELTPPDRRPYAGGSGDNHVMSLIFGYNGVARLWGEDWSIYIGTPGPLRLFNDKLAGQASWLLPFVLLSLPVAVAQARRQPARQQALVLWGTWLGVGLVYFSISSYFHGYYLATIAPAIAALAGIGADALWAAWRSRGWWRVWPVLALAGTAAVQAFILWPFPDWARRLIPLVAIVSLIAIAVLLAAWRIARIPERWPRSAYVAGVLALLVAPAVWAAIPVATCTNVTLPAAGPQECKAYMTGPFLDPDLVDYLQRERGGARFLAATYDSGIAMLGILETGEPFMALGGYRGSDPILTRDEFVQWVARGEARFFLNLEGEAESYPQQAPIRQWVADHCPKAPVQSPGVEVLGPCEVPQR